MSACYNMNWVALAYQCKDRKLNVKFIRHTLKMLLRMQPTKVCKCWYVIFICTGSRDRDPDSSVIPGIIKFPCEVGKKETHISHSFKTECMQLDPTTTSFAHLAWTFTYAFAASISCVTRDCLTKNLTLKDDAEIFDSLKLSSALQYVLPNRHSMVELLANSTNAISPASAVVGSVTQFLLHTPRPFFFSPGSSLY